MPEIIVTINPDGSTEVGSGGGIQFVEHGPGRHLPAIEPDSRRLGHRGQCAVDGVRQHGADLRDRRGVYA